MTSYFTDDKTSWQVKGLSDWPLITHIMGLKPRAQNFKPVKIIYLRGSLYVKYFKLIVW